MVESLTTCPNRSLISTRGWTHGIRSFNDIQKTIFQEKKYNLLAERIIITLAETISRSVFFLTVFYNDPAVYQNRILRDSNPISWSLHQTS